MPKAVRREPEIRADVETSFPTHSIPSQNSMMLVRLWGRLE